MGKFIDLTGKRFGKLVVIERVNKNKWKCKCDCGNTTLVQTGCLNNGSTIGCGCARKGSGIRDVAGRQFGRLKAIRPTDKRNCNEVVWECMCDCGSITMVPVGKLTSGNTQSCGCLKTETGEEIMKIGRERVKKYYHDGTYILNIKTETIRDDNTSGVRGVSFNKRSGKWESYITLKGCTHKLGLYTEKEDAIQARKLAEKKLFHPIIEEYEKENANV